jgi:uncharacterized tellurite resistance protein B-like protein
MAAIGTLGVILWRMQLAATATKEMVETANEVKGLFRGWSWRNKFARSSLDLVQDPREAVAAILVAVAQSDGQMTDREKQAIVASLTERVGATSTQAEELLAHGRWMTRDVHNLDACLAKLAPVLKKACTPEQIADVLAMVGAVASADDRPSGIEAEALIRLERLLK